MQLRKELWRLRLNWNEGTLSPGTTLYGTWFLENASGQALYIHSLRMKPEWLPYELVWPVRQHIPAKLFIFQWSPLLSFSLEIPADIVGEQGLAVGLHTYCLEPEPAGGFRDCGVVECGPEITLPITPHPIYRAFISRSIWGQDRPIIEPIIARIVQWGFDCRTVGINVEADDPARPTPEILAEIRASDCLIAIATPRDPLVKDGLWLAPEWIHGEVGIGFGTEKPILMIYDSHVRLGGLPAQFYSITYDPQNLHRLMLEIDPVMAQVRDWVRDKQANELWQGVLKCLGIVAVGAIAYQAGVDDGKHP